MSGVRQIGNTKYQVYTVFKQNVKRHCEAWKKQYSIKRHKGLLSKTRCSASESVVRLIYGDLGQTYVQF